MHLLIAGDLAVLLKRAGPAQEMQHLHLFSAIREVNAAPAEAR